ncbi:lytic transglycosylase domain-containing protein [Acinetobacter sp. V117_2]|uniref:lytic transglycosylase domain-containing protein n=1 Tax=Acinetobacter sp. V117_2 TaxID=3072989 RepID=UPI00287F2BE6|nr:lytic transglycosylase domain-containing protein [Acinetobacter sp. V117_2]MDS7966265.1 lytic transglycosylase domain-containing protein [Acinetobacter sp. V117_2]
MKNSVQYLFSCLLGMTTFSVGITPTFAGQMYVYQDKNGSTLLTNRKSYDNSLKKVKVTYYPDSNIHSYTNWGASEASVLPSYSRNKNAFDHIIKQAAQQHGVSEGLIKAVMHTESGFNVNAHSPVGAQGLMQLMPATARRFNVSNAYDPQQNIFAGAKYLGWLLKRFNGNTQMALAAYNAGEGNVDKYGGIPPFRETQDYVRRVTSRYQNLYSSGVSLSSFSNSNISAQAVNPPVSPQATTPQQVSAKPVKYSSGRQIVTLADGTYTDAPTGTYVTNNATAIAHIRIE